MQRALVLGFYDRHNLGDEAFKDALNHIVGRHFELEFCSVDDYEIKKIAANDFPIVICGGGDIINAYFCEAFAKILKGYTGFTVAVGVGISFPSLLDYKYLSVFDHVVLREKTDLAELANIIGSEHAHYMPDLVFALRSQLIVPSSQPVLCQKTIGVFLAANIMQHKSWIFNYTTFLDLVLRNTDYTLVFYAFNTETRNAKENDLVINKHVVDMLSHHGQRVQLDDTRYSIFEMAEKMHLIDFAICSRFHSQVLAIITGTPFLAVAATRKSQLLMNELELARDCHIDLFPLVEKERVLTFDPSAAFRRLQGVMEKSQPISERLAVLSEELEFLWSSKKLVRLLQNRKRRILAEENSDIVYVDVEQLVEKYQRQLELKNVRNKNGMHLPLPSMELARKIAESLCFDLTSDIISKYVHGTIENLQKFPEKIAEMIHWIRGDVYDEKRRLKHKLHLTYVQRNGFQGIHRSGWQHVVDYLTCLSSPFGVIFDPYVDRSFGWGLEVLKRKAILPYTTYWVGVVHHTFEESYSESNCVELFKKHEFLQSLHLCKGIYVLSEYLARWWRKTLDTIGFEHVAVNVLAHPTSSNCPKFSMKKFRANTEKRLVNVGAWYRNPFTICTLQLDEKVWRKSALRGRNMNNYFFPEGGFMIRAPLYLMSQKKKAATPSKKRKLEQLLGTFSGESERKRNKILSDQAYARLLEILDVDEEREKLLGTLEIANCNVSRDDSDNKAVYFLKEYILVNQLYKPLAFDNDNIILDTRADYTNDPERAFLQQRVNQMIASVEILTEKSNEQYDTLLSQNIVFLNLVSCSAANTLIECVVRNTPVVVNPHEAVVEVLGKDYPLYYTDAEKDVPLLLTEEKITAAHAYLKRLDKRKYEITHFIDAIKESAIYKNL